MSKVEELAKEYAEKFILTVDHQSDVEEAYIDGYRQAEEELIDKTIGWIEEINNHHHIMRYSDSCEPPISELTEWFKNYMKEGDKDE